MKISCRGCGNNEAGTFSYRTLLVAVADQRDDDTWSDLDPVNETDNAWLSCQVCGHTWLTKRRLRDGVVR